MGKVTAVGGKLNMEVPCIGLLASKVAVGSIVYLNENGSPVPYVVINQGIPSNSSLYDSSCNGTWLLRREIVTVMEWKTNYFYADNAIHTYLTSTFYNSFDNIAKGIIKTVKIPYVKRTGTNIGELATGANGLSTKVFLLSSYEVTSELHMENEGATLVDGAKVEYRGELWWKSRITPSENEWHDYWWLRTTNYAPEQINFVENFQSPYDANEPWINWVRYGYSGYGIRPALVLPNNAYFDKDTLVLKGVL